jgi:hypothetical protein
MNGRAGTCDALSQRWESFREKPLLIGGFETAMNYKQFNPTFSPLVELSQKDVTSFWLNLVEWRDTSVIFCHN